MPQFVPAELRRRSLTARCSVMAASKVVVLFAASCCLALSASAYRLHSQCPNIVSREEWGARKPTEDIAPLAISPAPFVVIHHGGTKTYCTTEAECSRIARSYQNYHMDSHGWFDIGYSFLVGEDGNVYEGRGWDEIGAHAPPYNNQSIGICVIGDFTDRLPNEKALRAVEQLIACGVQQGAISTQYGLLGHRQARPTLCPGDVFYSEVVSWQHWVAHPTPIALSPQPNTTTTTPSPSVNCV